MTSNLMKHPRGGVGRRPSGRGGFSLAELMISIGILAVGMSIVAALIPAAIAMNRRSARNVLGSIICENGVSIIRSAFGSGAVTKPNKLSTLAILNDDLRQTYLPASMCRFPQGDPDSDYGFISLHRNLDSDLNSGTEEGRQIVTVAFRRRLPERNLAVQFMMLRSVNLPTGKDTAMVLRNDEGNFRIGTPVIMSGTGDYATTRQIFRWASTSVDGEKSSYYTKALVNRVVDLNFVGTGWAVLEGSATDENREPRYSPALSTLVTRMSPDWR